MVGYLTATRIEKGLAQPEIESLMGFRPGMLERVEKAEKAIQWPKLEKWAGALGVAFYVLPYKPPKPAPEFRQLALPL